MSSVKYGNSIVPTKAKRTWFVQAPTLDFSNQVRRLQFRLVL
jgi:hypothetical protein